MANSNASIEALQSVSALGRPGSPEILAAVGAGSSTDARRTGAKPCAVAMVPLVVEQVRAHLHTILGSNREHFLEIVSAMPSAKLLERLITFSGKPL